MAFDLRKLLGMDHPQAAKRPAPQQAQRGALPVQQAPAVQLGNNSPAAAQYAANPAASQADPAQFGYPADNSAMHLGVQRQQSPANLGIPYTPDESLGQGDAYNPGFSPVQNTNSMSPQQAPVTHWQNLSNKRKNMVNPQTNDTGYFWQ